MRTVVASTCLATGAIRRSTSAPSARCTTLDATAVGGPAVSVGHWLLLDWLSRLTSDPPPRDAPPPREANPTSSTPTRLVLAIRGLSGADHEESDRDVLTGDSDDRERVEELVIAEDARRGVGATTCVHDRTDGVGDSSEREQDDRRRIQSGHELWQECDSDPSKGDPRRGGEPLRRAEPCELDDDRRRSRHRDEGERDGPPGTVECEQADGCVRPRDQEIDARVVEPAHPETNGR